MRSPNSVWCLRRFAACALVSFISAAILPQEAFAQILPDATITVTITHVKDRGIRTWDPGCLTPGCGAPDYYTIIKFVGENGQVQACPATRPISDQSEIYPNWVCVSTISHPSEVSIAIFDSDGSSADDQAVLTSGATKEWVCQLYYLYPSVDKNFSNSDVGDTLVEFHVHAEIRGVQIWGPTATPSSIDPSNGERTLLQGYTSSVVRLEENIVNASGSVVWSGYYPFGRTYSVAQPGKFVTDWNGKDDRGSIVPDGIYTWIVKGKDESGNFDAQPPELQSQIAVKTLPPGSLKFEQLSGLEKHQGNQNTWNPKAGPLGVEFVTSSLGQAGLKVFGTSNCMSPQVAEVYPTNVGPGKTTLSFNGKTLTNSWLPPGQYSIQLSAFDSRGRPTIPATVCQSVAITPSQPLILTADAGPMLIKKAGTYSGHVTITARPIDRNYNPRRTWNIRILFATAAEVNSKSEPKNPVMECTAADQCIYGVDVQSGPLAYRATAWDEDPTLTAMADTGWRQFDFSQTLLDRPALA